jgi:hypothetical protein
MSDPRELDGPGDPQELDGAEPEPLADPLDLPDLPGPEDRTVIIGRTGSGKTVGGLWHLSLQPIDEMPFLVFDYKKDDELGRIPFSRLVPIGEIPDEPGVYIVQPRPEDEGRITALLNRVLDRGNVGLFVDEGFMLAKDDAFNAILMQGRSKQIPVIVNTQRPVYVSRFVFSEASFVQVYHVLDRRDRRIISEFTPLFREDEDDALPEHYSWFYDVRADRIWELRPVPDAALSHALIAERLAPLHETENGAQVHNRTFI